MLSLEPVTPDNYADCLALAVREDQERFVAPVVRSLADAYVWGGPARAARSKGEIVGFVLLYPFELDGRPVVNIVRLLIDRHHQGHGLGRALLDETLALARSLEPRPERIRLSTLPDNDVALRLYRSVGFVEGGTDGPGIVLWLDVPPS